MGLVIAASLLASHAVIAQQPEPGPADLLAAAGRAFTAGDLETAEARLLDVTRLDPRAFPAWLGLAEIAERAGRPQDALEFARRAEASAPSEPRVLAVLGRILARSGASVAAVEILARAIEADPRDAASYLLAALLLRDQDKSEQAIELLERARGAGIDEPAVIHELGFLLLAAGKPERAEQLVEDALPGDRSPATVALLGLAMVADPQRRPAAIPLLEEAIRSGAPMEGLTRLELASVLLEAGRVAEAVEHLQTAQGLLDDDLEATYRLAVALRAAGRTDEATATLSRYQEMRSARETADSRARQLGTELNEAYEAAAENRLQDALERLDSILSEAPDHVATLALRAKTAFSAGDQERALADIAHCRALEPGNAEFAYLEGLFLLAGKRLPEAEASLRRALILEPDLAEAQQLMAMLAVEQGRWREAAVWVAAARSNGAANAILDSLGERVAQHLDAQRSEAQRVEEKEDG